MKKSLISLALAIVLGIAAGVVTTEIRHRMLTPESIEPPRLATDSQRQPQAQIDQTEYDFGRMDLDVKGQHEFVIRNMGEAPLRLESGPTTCSCTVSNLDKKELPPGGSTTVRIDWNAKGEPGPYQQTAAIITNDPKNPRIELTVRGVMVAAVQAKPSEVIFPQLSGTRQTSQIVDLYGFRDEPLQIQGHSFGDPSLAHFFEVHETPLGAEDLKAMPGATSGVQVRISVKSGLPQGPLRQTITFRTNLAERPTIELPIQGDVVSDISLFGPGWDGKSERLRLGTVSRAAGVKRNLTILVRGPHTKQVRLEVVETYPESLHAQISAPKFLRGDSASQSTLSVEVAPNSPPGRYLGTAGTSMGRIRIKTTHPDIPELLISVPFVIEGS